MREPVLQLRLSRCLTMYVLNADRQHHVLRRLTPLDGAQENWHAVFTDPKSGQRWVRFFHHSEAHGGAWPVLRTDPPPTQLAAWLAVCFRSGDSEDVLGLAWELSRDYELWPQVLAWLEAERQTIDAEAIRLFIKHLEILPSLNRRPTLGKDLTAIDEDHRHFVELSARARNLIANK